MLTPETAQSLIPPEAVRRYGVVPLRATGEAIEVGAAEAVPASVVRDLALLTGRRIVTEIVGQAEIAAYLRELPQAPESDSSEPSGTNEALQQAHPPNLSHQDSLLNPTAAEADGGSKTTNGIRAPYSRPAHSPSFSFGGGVVQQVQEVIQRAIERGASDIHIEPYEERLRVRYRLDGVLQEVGELPLARRDAVAARLKVMAELDIAEKRRPQDGRITVAPGGHRVDLRVSTLPTGFGEKVVLRVLDRRDITLDLGALGMTGADLAIVRAALGAPHGMVLVTGPTGSGKTTTLYAALSALDTTALNVSTVEDPVEYDLPGVNQTRVRPEIGLTFATALRAFLRQDPDVLLVGEVRDRETAEVALRAALTGHLVLTTLHTNDAPSALLRLADMGVEAYLVAATIRLVVAQRLVRKVCLECRRRMPVQKIESRQLVARDLDEVWVGDGCDACHGTGYAGRIALFEVMEVGDEVAGLVTEGAPSAAVRRAARDAGMRTLREAGLALVRSGVTTPAEVLRATA